MPQIKTSQQFLNEKFTTLEAAVCVTAGLDRVEQYFDDKTLEAAHKQYMHGVGFRDVLHICAQENGYSSYATQDIGPLYDYAFGVKGIKAAGFSSISLPGILSNIANKFLNEGFMNVDSSWRDISSRRAVPDFKQSSSYSLTGDLTYELVGPAGELKSGSLGELAYTNQILSYGRLLTISRRDLVNDDLGALTQAAMRLGRGAGLALAKVFWTAYLANVSTMFASGNANVLTGGGSALSITSLGSAQSLFRKQTGPDGEPLAVVPKILLTPPELEIAADALVHQTSINTGGASTEAQVSSTATAKYRPVTSSYLSNSNYTGYSTTAWYLLADPKDMPTVEVAFLNGRDSPTIERAQADSSVLGINMRAYHDFGIGMLEPRGGVRAAGA
jgi:phage major head subunit gpT-like protein